MTKITISTTLNPDDIVAAKKLGLHWNQLIRLGIRNTLEMREKGNIIEDMRRDKEVLSRRVQELARKVFQLENPEYKEVN